MLLHSAWIFVLGSYRAIELVTDLQIGQPAT